MNDGIPKSKWRRGLSGGKTAAKVGGLAACYLAKKPFLSEEARQAAKAELSRDSAEIVFEGLSVLRGTALKIAQMLSLELELFPEAIRRELEKSYNQTPPINRALVGKIIKNEFGRSPEKVFRTFDTKAFAAASLGQVHTATAFTGEHLAVKVQYPGMKDTIENDIKLVRILFKSLPENRFISPALDEIEVRLLEETDYRRELDNLVFFKNRMGLERVFIPDVFEETSGTTVLSLSYIEGMPLNHWIKTNPDQEARDEVARVLREIWLQSLYEMNCIHADPNPGNFIIRPDNSVGLIDFGCVKRMPADYVDYYRQLPRAAMTEDSDLYFQILRSINVVRDDLSSEARDKVMALIRRAGQWFSQLYRSRYFDFRAEQEFISQGQALMVDFYRIREEVELNPDMLFFNRTVYGLVRLYEMLGARVAFGNPYEWDE